MCILKQIFLLVCAILSERRIPETVTEGGQESETKEKQNRMYIIKVQLKIKHVIKILLLLQLADLVTLAVLDPLGAEAEHLLAAAAGAGRERRPAVPVQ